MTPVTITLLSLIIGCIIILIISTYYCLTYKDTPINIKTNAIKDSKLNIIKNRLNKNLISNEKLSTELNQSDQQTLNSQGYECRRWENDDIALRIKDGNVQCASIDGKNCIATCTDDFDVPLITNKTVTCGEYYKKIYDFTGYDDTSHWCYEYADYIGGLGKDPQNNNIIRSGDTISLAGGQNNKFCSDDSRGMQCNREIVEAWEKLAIEKIDGPGPIKDGDIIIIKGPRNNRYCSYDDDNKIRCNNIIPGLWNKFIIINRTNRGDYIRSQNKIAFKSLKSKAYCSDTSIPGDFNKIVNCSSNLIGEWEEFRIKKI